jgi:hypothetical protein
LGDVLFRYADEVSYVLLGAGTVNPVPVDQFEALEVEGIRRFLVGVCGADRVSGRQSGGASGQFAVESVLSTFAGAPMCSRHYEA